MLYRYVGTVVDPIITLTNTAHKNKPWWLDSSYIFVKYTIHSSLAESLRNIKYTQVSQCNKKLTSHDGVIKWKYFRRYWPFVRGIHRSPINSPQKGQWRGALMFSLICPSSNSWVNHRDDGDLRRHRAHCNVFVMGMGTVEIKLVR